MRTRPARRRRGAPDAEWRNWARRPQCRRSVGRHNGRDEAPAPALGAAALQLQQGGQPPSLPEKGEITTSRLENGFVAALFVSQSLRCRARRSHGNSLLPASAPASASIGCGLGHVQLAVAADACPSGHPIRSAGGERSGARRERRLSPCPKSTQPAVALGESCPFPPLSRD